jgi:hypothetical protein
MNISILIYFAVTTHKHEIVYYSGDYCADSLPPVTLSFNSLTVCSGVETASAVGEISTFGDGCFEEWNKSGGG